MENSILQSTLTSVHSSFATYFDFTDSGKHVVIKGLTEKRTAQRLYLLQIFTF